MLNDAALPSIDRVMNSYPFELSGGMKQRVLIGMALADNPSLVLADEPGTALDVTTNGVILELMRKKVAERGLSIIYVTHNLAVARGEYAENICHVCRSDRRNWEFRYYFRKSEASLYCRFDSITTAAYRCRTGRYKGYRIKLLYSTIRMPFLAPL